MFPVDIRTGGHLVQIRGVRATWRLIVWHQHKVTADADGNANKNDRGNFGRGSH